MMRIISRSHGRLAPSAAQGLDERYGGIEPPGTNIDRVSPGLAVVRDSPERAIIIVSRRGRSERRRGSTCAAIRPRSRPSRRRLIQQLSLIPLTAGSFAGCAKRSDKPPDPAAPRAGPYQPRFFSAAEWAFIEAACDRLIPADDIGPSASQAGVPEFIDRHMQTPYAAGDIWYMQGPFVEAAPQFGYQGRLPVRDILRVGIKRSMRIANAGWAARHFRSSIKRSRRLY
jgi:hypothetical protein